MSIINRLYRKVFIRRKAQFLNKTKKYQHYDIGEWTYGNPEIISFGEGAKLRIGKFCSIANGVTIMLGGEHRIDWITTYPFNVLFEKAKHYKGHPFSKGDVVIGNDVWIGKGAFILSGVTIGDGAVVGAKSVVTRDIEPYVIVGGNPSRFIRYRFSESLIADLLRISWWDWPSKKIEEALPLLLSSDIEGFVNKYLEK